MESVEDDNGKKPLNLYVHFPFCRSKCTYCALHSRAGASESEKTAYCDGIATEIAKRDLSETRTIYFGGGTPSQCEVWGVCEALKRSGARIGKIEFTMEVNPADVTQGLVAKMLRGGVNRVSMGVQSLSDRVLREMGRPHTAAEAEQAWRTLRDGGFENVGFDLICGWPNGDWKRTMEAAVRMDPEHCSVYTLIREEGTKVTQMAIPSDDEALAELGLAERMLREIGLERYEISNFAKAGRECRHNMAVWRGEDYTGIGEGAMSREGGAVSRVIFRLRLLKEGLNLKAAIGEYPELREREAEWAKILRRFASEGALREENGNFRLTKRGEEICDTILAELV